MYKIRLYSDLHLEFGGFTIPALPDDKDTLLVLAGDIAVGKRKPTYMDWIDRATDQFRKVVYIPGNHEYYGGAIPRTWQKMKENMVEQLYDQGFDAYLHMINNQIVHDGDVVIVGSTLWTDFDKANPLTMAKAGSFMNDYRVIRTGPTDDPYKTRLRPEDTLREHHRAKVFIFEQCRKWKAEGKTVIVVTHHAPSFQSVGPDYIGDELNGAYCTELAYDILDLDDQGLAPDLWFHGHVHNTFDYNIGSTRVMTNPRGYVKYDNGFPENKEFNPEFLIEL